MKFELIPSDEGFFVLQGSSDLHKLIPDADLGATLRAMVKGGKAEKVKDSISKVKRPRRTKAQIAAEKAGTEAVQA